MAWEGKSIHKEGKRSYYEAVCINGERVGLGECVSVKPDDPSTPVYISRIMYMWEEGDGSMMFHGHWFRSVSSSISSFYFSEFFLLLMVLLLETFCGVVCT